MKLKKMFSTRRKIVAFGLGSAMAVAGAGAAFAYFNATANTAAYATVGTGSWSVSFDSLTGGPLFPGSGSEAVNYTVTNTSSGNVQLNSVDVTVDQDGNGFVLNANNGNAPVANCYASWFSVSNDGNAFLAANIAGGGTFVYHSTITIPADNADNQSACEGVAPALTITAS